MEVPRFLVFQFQWMLLSLEEMHQAVARRCSVCGDTSLNDSLTASSEGGVVANRACTPLPSSTRFTLTLRDRFPASPGLISNVNYNAIFPPVLVPFESFLKNAGATLVTLEAVKSVIRPIPWDGSTFEPSFACILDFTIILDVCLGRFYFVDYPLEAQQELCALCNLHLKSADPLAVVADLTNLYQIYDPSLHDVALQSDASWTALSVKGLRVHLCIIGILITSTSLSRLTLLAMSPKIRSLVVLEGHLIPAVLQLYVFQLTSRSALQPNLVPVPDHSSVRSSRWGQWPLSWWPVRRRHYEFRYGPHRIGPAQAALVRCQPIDSKPGTSRITAGWPWMETFADTFAVSTKYTVQLWK